MRGAWAALLLMALAACTRPAPGVCCISADDCASIGVTNGDRPCASGMACGADHLCGAPPTIDALSVDALAGCGSDSDCSAPTAICAPDHTCVGCIDSSTCPLSAPTCDATSRTCRACGSDADCASEVCDPDAGTCVDAAGIVYAAPTGSDGAACTSADPCSIVHAFAVAGNLRSTIKLEPGSYAGSDEIDLEKQQLFVDGAGAMYSSTFTGDSFYVDTDSTLRVIGLAVVSGGAAFACGAGSDGVIPGLSLEQVSADAELSPILTASCTVEIERSHLVTHSTNQSYASFFTGVGNVSVNRTIVDGGTIFAANEAVVRVSNSVIRSAGADGVATGDSASSITVSYSTLINSTVVDCGTGSPACAGGAAEGVCVNDSVILNTLANAPADTVTVSAGCVVSYSIVFPEADSLGGAGNEGGVNPVLVDPTGGDYHLQPGSPAIDSADPLNAGSADFDGTPRPQGLRSDMGAFELKQ